MGNVPTSARVMRPDGTVVEYNYRIQVAMLMTLHPNYLVIHSPIGPVAPGERRNVKVMDLKDRVTLGHSYIMYPIPSQYKTIFSNPPVRAKGVSSRTSRYQDLKLTLLAKFTKRTTGKGGRRKRSCYRPKVMQNDQKEIDMSKSSHGVRQKMTYDRLQPANDQDVEP